MKEPRPFVPFLIVLQLVLLPGSRAFPQVRARKWTEVQSPHFLIITNGSEKRGRQLAYQFEAIRSVFEQTLGLRVESGMPFVVMGFKDEKSQREAMPEFWEKKGLAHPAGGFLRTGDKIYAFVRLDAGEDIANGIVYHEYTHMILHLNVGTLPLWMDEGLAQFYQFSTIGEKEVRLGRPNADSILALRRGKHLPLADLFRVTYDSPYYIESSKAPVFYAESWALTHYLMLEEAEAGQPNRLTRFLALQRQGVDRDEAAGRVFDDPGRLQAGLSRYVERSTFPYILIKTKAAGGSKHFGVRALSPAETAARLGDFIMHGHRPEDGKPLLEEALRLQPGLASALESMGLLFMWHGDRVEALRWFGRAIAGEAQGFLAHYYHAMLTLSELGTADGGGQAEADLASALRLNPDFAPANMALAELYLEDGRRLDQALELARRAVDIEPWSFSYQLTLGKVLVRLGRHDEALKHGRTMERVATSQDQKNTVRSFMESLTQVLEKKNPGPESEQAADPGLKAGGERPAQGGPQPFSFKWSVVSGPTLISDFILAEGSGDGLYISKTYDEVWAATITALARKYAILYSEKKSGRIMAEPNSGSNEDRAFGSLTIFIKAREDGIGVNIAVGLGSKMSLSTRTSIYKALFEDIAAILARPHDRFTSRYFDSTA